MLCDIINIIFKTVKPSHLKKSLIKENINNRIFQVIFKFSDWVLIKQFKIFSTPFCCWEKRIFECLGEWVISFCLGCDGKNFVASFEYGGAWVKMSRFNAFSRNLNAINLKIFLTHVEIYVFERKHKKYSGEISKTLRSL